jgi:hypothetical protein
MIKGLRFFLVAEIILTVACVSTPYKGISASELTDNQLIEELQYVYNELGISVSNLNTAILTQPAPIYKITATSFTDMSWRTNYYGNSSYSTGTATTTTNYRVQNTNQMNQSIAQLGVAIARARIQELNKRRQELEQEYDGRIEKKNTQERDAQNAMRNFFAAHPSLNNEIPLLQAIIPWESTDNYRETLNRLGFEAESVLASRAAGRISGRWYGNLQLRETESSTSSNPSTSLIRGNVEESEASIRISLAFTNGAIIKIIGIMNDTTFEGDAYFKDKNDKPFFSSPLKGNANSREIRLLIEKEEKPGQFLHGILTLTR